MAFGRGHATFTIDTLKLSKDSLPAAVNEPPPVFPELLHTPHPLNENPANDYDYKLKLKINFISNFRTLHDPNHQKDFRLNHWKEEWDLLPKELKQMSRIRKRIPVAKVNLIGKKKKKMPVLDIDLNGLEEKPVDAENEDEDEEEKREKVDEIDIDDEEKPKDAEKKRITDNENEIDGDIDLEEEEDMDENEAADYTYSYFDAGDGDDDDLDDDGGDGAD